MRRSVVPLILLAAVLAGCAERAPQGRPAPPAVPQAVPQTVTLQRTGGFAGDRDVIVVQPDGSWRRTAMGPPNGTLTAEENAALARMEADPALAGEAGRPQGGIECADGYDLVLTVGDTTVRWQDCGSATSMPPVAASIAALLLNSTR